MAKTETKTKKTAAKKPAAKKSAAKKTTAKKTAPRKTAARKATPKKTAPQAAESTPRRGSTIAQRVAFRTRNKKTILSVLAMVFFSLLAGFFYFGLVGYSFSALVCMCIVAIVGFYELTRRLMKKYPRDMRVVRRIFSIILCIGLLVVGITEAIIIKASFGNPEESCDYLVVLGAKVRQDRPSLSLQNRIDAAYDYLTEHPDVIAVVTGGQGEDEPTTEAQCMYDHLTQMGIDPDRIWMEDKATSTWENLHFSLDLIEEKTGTRPGKLGVLSSEYHLFRASLFAKAAGVEFVGVPAETTILSLKINYFMREVAGVWHYILLGGQYQ